MLLREVKKDNDIKEPIIFGNLDSVWIFQEQFCYYNGDKPDCSRLRNEVKDWSQGVYSIFWEI